jgi:ribonuclease HIII
VERALRSSEGWTEEAEQSCAYRLDFSVGGERAIVKQYTNGTLYLQAVGRPGQPSALLDRLAKTVEAAGAVARSVGVPDAGVAGANGTGRPSARSAPRGSSVGVNVARPFDGPWIGSDESGKGDYFGPLVACAVYVDDRLLALLQTLGVRDSKQLSDGQNRRLADEVRVACDGRYAEVPILPERYNDLYEQFKREGKNLNTLLAWGHARAIETVMERVPCQNVIVDQFADARYLRTRLDSVARRLMAGSGPLNVVQLPRAEANLAVAAASVLARDRFLSWLARTSRDLGIDLPKGAAPQVEAAARRLVATHGPAVLRRTAKLHFKTTQRILPS